jgi:hypothetical protein
MSVSSSDLFTGDYPPGFLSPVLHRVGNNLIYFIDGIPPDAEERVSSRRDRRLLCLAVPLDGIADELILGQVSTGLHLVVHVPL